ncbi:hypothetical protein T265_05967 [Opisthorchis viverrini]|uniref:Uncharacterized protein n=1 Tax=Opisthorchis viverrini TaxID=6198 RepID=A0A074ZIL2_OPIVI|nr:hypothetical protein T265_05967 [Opisthorchis viverrini]KER26831.1 hypothetical protein T265_05967 [Opisthorchis viverrini]
MWLNPQDFGVTQCNTQTNSSARVQSAPSDQQPMRAETGVHVFKQISVTGLTDSMRVDSWISVQTESKPQKRTGRQRPQKVSSASVTPSYRSDSSERQRPVPYESVEFFPKPAKSEHRARQKQLRNQPIYERLPSSLEKIRSLPSEPASREDIKSVDVKEDMGPVPVGTISKCDSSVQFRQKSLDDRPLSASVEGEPERHVVLNSGLGKRCSDTTCKCQKAAAVYQLQDGTYSSESQLPASPSKSAGQETVPEGQLFPHLRAILSDEYERTGTRPNLEPDSNVDAAQSNESSEPRATMHPEAVESPNLDLKNTPSKATDVQQNSQKLQTANINREGIPSLTTRQNVPLAMTSGTLEFTAVDVNNMVQFSSPHIQHYSSLPNDLRLALIKAFETMLRSHLGPKRLLRATWDCVIRLLITKYGVARGENFDSRMSPSAVQGGETVNTGTVGSDCTDPDNPSEVTNILGELYQEIFGSVPDSSKLTELMNNYITDLDPEHLKHLFQEQPIKVASEPTEQRLQDLEQTYQKVAQSRSSQLQPIQRSSPSIQLVFGRTYEEAARTGSAPPRTSWAYLISLNSGQVDCSPEPLHTEHHQKTQQLTPASSSKTKDFEVSELSTAHQPSLPVDRGSAFERSVDGKTRSEKTHSYPFLVPSTIPGAIQSMKEELTIYQSEAALNESEVIQSGSTSDNFRVAFAGAFDELLQSEHGWHCLFPAAAWKYISSCIIHRPSHPASEAQKGWTKHTADNSTPIAATTNSSRSSRTGPLRIMTFDPRAVFESAYEEVIHSWLDSSHLFLLTTWNYIMNFLAQRHPEIIEKMTENLRQTTSVSMVRNTGAPSDFPRCSHAGPETVERTHPNAPESIFSITQGDIRYLNGILGEWLNADVVPILLQTSSAPHGPIRCHTSVGLKNEQSQEVGGGSLLTVHSALECVWVDPKQETCLLITLSSSIEGIVSKQSKCCLITSARLEKYHEIDRTHKGLHYPTFATVTIQSTIVDRAELYINMECLTIEPSMYILMSVVLISPEHRLTLQTLAGSTQYLINISVNLSHSGVTVYLVSCASNVLEPLQSQGYLHIRPSRIPEDYVTRTVEISHVVSKLEDSGIQSHSAYSSSKRTARGHRCLIRNPPVTRSHSHSARLSRSSPTIQPPPYPPHKSSLGNQIRTYSAAIPNMQSTNSDLERVSRVVTWDWNRQFGQLGQWIPNCQEFGRVNMQDEYEIRRGAVPTQGSQPSVTINLGALAAGQHYDLEVGDITGFRIGIRAHGAPTSQTNATGEANMDGGNEPAMDTVNQRFGNENKPSKNCIPITRIFRRKSASHLR